MPDIFLRAESPEKGDILESLRKTWILEVVLQSSLHPSWPRSSHIKINWALRQRLSFLYFPRSMIYKRSEIPTYPMGKWETAELRVWLCPMKSPKQREITRQKLRGQPRRWGSWLCHQGPRSARKNLGNVLTQNGKRLVVIGQVVVQISYIQQWSGRLPKMPYKSEHPFCTFITKRIHVIPFPI